LPCVVFHSTLLLSFSTYGPLSSIASIISSDTFLFFTLQPILTGVYKDIPYTNPTILSVKLGYFSFRFQRQV